MAKENGKRSTNPNSHTTQKRLQVVVVTINLHESILSIILPQIQDKLDIASICLCLQSCKSSFDCLIVVEFKFHCITVVLQLQRRNQTAGKQDQKIMDYISASARSASRVESLIVLKDETIKI